MTLGIVLIPMVTWLLAGIMTAMAVGIIMMATEKQEVILLRLMVLGITLSIMVIWPLLHGCRATVIGTTSHHQELWQLAGMW